MNRAPKRIATYVLQRLTRTPGEVFLAAAAACAILVTLVALGLGAPWGRAVSSVVLVQVGENAEGETSDAFTPGTLQLNAGDTVHWEWSAGIHDVTSYWESAPGVSDWQSDLLRAPGDYFEREFSAPGTYTYYCSIHALREDAAPEAVEQSLSAGRMVGKIVVMQTPTESPTPAPTASSVPTTTPAPTSSPSPSPSPAPSATPAPSPTPGSSPTPSPTLTATPTATPAATPIPTPTATPTPTYPPSPAPTNPAATPSPPPPPAHSTAVPPPSPVQFSAPPVRVAPSVPLTARASETPTRNPSSVADTLRTPGPVGTPTPSSSAAHLASDQGSPPGRAPDAPRTVLTDVGGGLTDSLFQIMIVPAALATLGLVAVLAIGFAWIERASRSEQPR